MKQGESWASYEHIYFEPFWEYGRKTQSWWCRAKRDDVCLGTVHWHSPWRQYVFAPKPDTIFHDGCMKDVAHFLGRCRDEHKAALANRRKAKAAEP
jgi:hypothetical protein